MTRTVSVVIPTIGRASLRRAVQSALDQTVRVAEIIVVADTDEPVALPPDDRISVIRSGGGRGPSGCRQIGIDAASSGVIALLDDDDMWCADKLARQLDATDAVVGAQWIVSSRMSVLGPGSRRRTWPRRLVRRGESLAEYLFRFEDLGFGGAALQASTLCFPVELGRAVRWDLHSDAAHDEASWLISAQRTFPDLAVIQLPDVLSVYDVTETSVSRDGADRTAAYIDWGLRYLGDESPRVLGDYLCTSPVTVAVSAGAVRSVWRSLVSALRCGRPGPYAMAYALLAFPRVLRRRSAG